MYATINSARMNPGAQVSRYIPREIPARIENASFLTFIKFLRTSYCVLFHTFAAYTYMLRVVIIQNGSHEL